MEKFIDGSRLQAPAQSTDPGPNHPRAKKAELAIGSIVRNLILVNVYEGGENDLIVRDVLPEGLKFLQANLVDHAGNHLAALTPSSQTDTLLVFSHETISDFKAISGGRIGNNAIFIELCASCATACPSISRAAYWRIPLRSALSAAPRCMTTTIRTCTCMTAAS